MPDVVCALLFLHLHDLRRFLTLLPSWPPLLFTGSWVLQELIPRTSPHWTHRLIVSTSSYQKALVKRAGFQGSLSAYCFRRAFAPAVGPPPSTTQVGA